MGKIGKSRGWKSVMNFQLEKYILGEDQKDLLLLISCVWFVFWYWTVFKIIGISAPGIAPIAEALEPTSPVTPANSAGNEKFGRVLFRDWKTEVDETDTTKGHFLSKPAIHRTKLQRPNLSQWYSLNIHSSPSIAFPNKTSSPSTISPLSNLDNCGVTIAPWSSQRTPLYPTLQPLKMKGKLSNLLSFHQRIC